MLRMGYSRSTLRDRNATTKTHREAANHPQRLPKVVENRLADLILHQEALGHGVTHAQIRVFGERLLVLRIHTKRYANRDPHMYISSLLLPTCSLSFLP